MRSKKLKTIIFFLAETQRMQRSRREARCLKNTLKNRKSQIVNIYLKLKKRITNNNSAPLCLRVILFFLLTFYLTPIFAQEEGRPLRAVEPEEAINIEKTLYNDVYWALLTETALEQPLTKQYIAQYTTRSGLASLNTIIERGRLYLPFIKEEIIRRGLPMDLAYLPVIESGFQITAKSRSGAAGLWQFMMNSISPFDITVNDIIDERSDFIKSTSGALQKLEREYRRLGSWELTLAAYNSGLNAVTRIVQRTGNNDYWELSTQNEFRRETLHFVPKLTAVVYVLSQPRKYGINIWRKELKWETIPLPRQVSLDLLADETGINRDILRRLNAELLYGISPADNNYRLKIPSSHIEKVTETLSRTDLRLIRYHYHVVRHGDTIWSMTRQYGTTLAMIEQHNPGIGGRFLRIGETIIIPAFGDAPPPAARPALIPQDYPGIHIVQKGETFWSLGRLYGVDPEELAKSNGMQMNQILHEGRSLKVPIIE